MTRRVKYAKDDAGIVERTMFQQHDKGYCLRPNPCVCDEGREALARLVTARDEAVAALRWYADRDDINNYDALAALATITAEVERLRARGGGEVLYVERIETHPDGSQTMTYRRGPSEQEEAS